MTTTASSSIASLITREGVDFVKAWLQASLTTGAAMPSPALLAGTPRQKVPLGRMAQAQLLRATLAAAAIELEADPRAVLERFTKTKPADSAADSALATAAAALAAIA